jgi:hypothetical protein
MLAYNGSVPGASLRVDQGSDITVQVAGYLKAYAAAFDLPVRLNSPVTRLSQTDEGFKDPHAA